MSALSPPGSGVAGLWCDIQTAGSLVLHDMARATHSTPCPDCGRSYLDGENVTMTVPQQPSGVRVVWSGCAHCWVRRTTPYVGAALEPVPARQMRTALDAIRAYATAHTTNLGSLAHDSISARHVLALLPPEETSAQGGRVNGPRVSARVDVPLRVITPGGES